MREELTNECMVLKLRKRSKSAVHTQVGIYVRTSRCKITEKMSILEPRISDL